MPECGAEQVSVGKPCLPCLGLCQALVLVAADRCSCRGSGVINKRSLHFLLEAFLLFSHNMLSCFEKTKHQKKTNKNKTKHCPEVAFWQGRWEAAGRGCPLHPLSSVRPHRPCTQPLGASEPVLGELPEIKTLPNVKIKLISYF